MRKFLFLIIGVALISCGKTEVPETEIGESTANLTEYDPNLVEIGFGYRAINGFAGYYTTFQATGGPDMGKRLRDDITMSIYATLWSEDLSHYVAEFKISSLPEDAGTFGYTSGTNFDSITPLLTSTIE
ncbi:MAG: hypothetical protein LIO79_09420 [Rikenellaceae bacterium]|nr:hypothetical protein [Rikenellaceae bacterium]